MTVEFKMLNEQQRQKVADALWRRERPRCQSGLVYDLLNRGGVGGFAWEDIANLTPDPSDWTWRSAATTSGTVATASRNRTLGTWIGRRWWKR